MPEERKSARDTATIMRRLFKILQLIHEYELKGTELSYSDLEKLTGFSYKSIMGYVRVLEELGFVRTEYRVPKVVVKLTEKGRCLINCLVSGT